MKKKSTFVAIIAIAFGSILGASTAQAASFSWSSQPLTNLNPDGAVIHGGFIGFPTASGLYIQECAAPSVAGQRPNNCVDLAWVTSTGAQGSTSSKGDISFTLKANFNGKVGAVNCAVVQCGLFFRLDHVLPTDTSEDTFTPITFNAAVATNATLRLVDAITLTLNGATLTKNVPANLGYRAVAVLKATSTSALPVTLTSATPDCTVVGNVLTALKGAGVCAINAATAGNTQYEVAKANYPFILVDGTQSIPMKALTLKRGATKALPAATNFGTDVTYSSNTKGCKVELNIINAVSGKSCLVKVTAPAKTGMWGALAQTIKVTIK
jgi:hypothetical protein